MSSLSLTQQLPHICLKSYRQLADNEFAGPFPREFESLPELQFVLILFGRGRISEMMGDFGKGINSFKKGLGDTEEAVSETKAQIEAPAKDAKDEKTSEKSETSS